jgi:hypothetical protein
VRTYKLLSDGRRQIDAFHFPGDVFGMEWGDVHRLTGSRGLRTISKPAIWALPEVGGSMVVSILTSVLLPAPLGPIKPNISPDRTLTLTASTTT